MEVEVPMDLSRGSTSSPELLDYTRDLELVGGHMTKTLVHTVLKSHDGTGTGKALSWSPLNLRPPSPYTRQ